MPLETDIKVKGFLQQLLPVKGMIELYALLKIMTWFNDQRSHVLQVYYIKLQNI